MSRVFAFKNDRVIRDELQKNGGGVSVLLDQIQSSGHGRKQSFKMHAVAAAEGGRLVYEMRCAAGFTQQQLAQAIGLSQQRISKIEAGNTKSGPTLPILFEVADACNVNFSLRWHKEEHEKDLNIKTFPDRSNNKGSRKIG